MTTYSIESSTELMQNYLQATIMAPDQQFVAVQNTDGGALLFSIGEDGAFNVTAETPGVRQGWNTINLSHDYPGKTCAHFAVAQRDDLSLQLAMVLRSTVAGHPSDELYRCSLSPASLGIVKAPTWNAVPYDDPTTPRPQLEVAGVFLSEATDGEYLIADVVRDPGSNTHEITRYYIDSAKAGGKAWHQHDVPVDIEAGSYASVLGRKSDASIDGVYVSGEIDGKPQIIYTPLFNDLRPDRNPLTDYLALTKAGDRRADAIAACRNPDASSDLYATAAGVLYRFASSNQGNGSVATIATSNSLFTGVKDLFAFALDDVVTVWGRNAENETFYTSCPRAKVDDPAAWTLALPILAGVEQVSPFINRANSANTLLAHTGEGALKMGVKSPGTGNWTWRDVTLPPADTKVPARSFNSYTTTAHVKDATNKPAAGAKIALSSPTVTSVYINHLYYIVGPTPIHVATDVVGTLTIVEAVPRLTGAQWQMAVVDDPTSATAVNPMHKAFKKATDLQSTKALRDASIPTYVNGKKVTPRKLVRDGVDDGTLGQVAHLNMQCAAVYADPKKPPSPAHLKAMAAAGPRFVVPADAPKVDAGDLFQYLETRPTQLKVRTHAAADSLAEAQLGAQETFWEMLVRWFEDAWEFVVKIGEAIYRCVLSVIEDVVSAVRWVFDKIIAAIEDLIEFLQYLFEWDDFKRTKDVLQNLTEVFLNHEVDQITVMRKEFDQAIDSVVAAIDAWSGVKDFSKVGPAAEGQMSSQGSASGPDAPGGLLSHHLQGNIHGASPNSDPSGQPPSASLISVVEQALKNEEKALGNAFKELQDLIKAAPGMTVGAILKGIVGILGDAIVRSAQVVIDALLDLLAAAMKAALSAFTGPMHIPVISDILNAIGIPDFSMLDVMCWVAAVPVTIGYKLGRAIAGKDHAPPFPDNPETTFLIETKDYATLVAAFTAPTQLRRAAPAAVGAGPIVMSPVAAEAVFIALHSAAGVCAWVSAFLDAFESLIPNPEVPMALTGCCVASAIVGGLSRAIANFLVPKYPLEGAMINIWSKFFTFCFLFNKVVFGAAGLRQGEDDPSDYRAAAAGLDAVLVIPAFIITCVHFHQLGEKDAGNDRTIAILDETSFVATYVARVIYTLVVTGVFDGDKEVKAGMATAMGVTQVIHGVLQFSEAAVEGVG